METYKIENITFKYPLARENALSGVNITAKKGEFITVCGKSGCGKSTLLRLLKPVLAPAGERMGEIFFLGTPINDIGPRESAGKIGFVSQNCENQIVTDKVWHEIAFGLESLGFPAPVIRTRVSETASFFGIEAWFHKDVSELSGGQKQLLTLASIMVMQPEVLLLDEPTAQLDPIAAIEFINVLKRINSETGTTIIIAEHRLEEVFAVSDRIIVMDGGKIIADAPPRLIAPLLENNEMRRALPAPALIWSEANTKDPCPLTVGEGRAWLFEYAAKHIVNVREDCEPLPYKPPKSPAAELKNVWFRYSRDEADVIKGLSLTAGEGEVLAIVGGNGAGKTTALSLISGSLTPQRGSVKIYGKPMKKISPRGIIGMLPQNVQTLFTQKTVRLDMEEVLRDTPFSEEEKTCRVDDTLRFFGLCGAADSHPYDLSGGEQQRAALAKVILCEPKILLMDEPTKGMDACFKADFAKLLRRMKENGTAVIMVTHDLEFCAETADICALLFDGEITSMETPRKFFSGNRFYTTAANRMTRDLYPAVILPSDLSLRHM